MQIGIIGIGLIGGSLSLDLKDQMGIQVAGCDHSPEHEKIARSLGIIDKIIPKDQLVRESDIIVLAVPVHQIEVEATSILKSINSHQVLIDTGSTKESICAHLATHENRNRFVAAHPLAGTEHSGPRAALKGLFNGKKNIICESEKSDQDAVELTARLFKSIGMESFHLSAAEHDKHLAFVSHLSHVSSFMLGLTVLELEKDEKQISNLASTGFESTVRLAKSSPETWAAIFDKNARHVGDALEQYINHLSRFLELLRANKKEEYIQLMKEANDVRRILDGIKV